MRISMCSPPYGGIAQLGERLNGIQEVSGSIPLISTKMTNRKDKTLRFRYTQTHRERIHIPTFKEGW